MRNHSELELMLKGYGLTTAQIFFISPITRICCRPMSGRITISPRDFRC
jgi:hypothetical protein